MPRIRSTKPEFWKSRAVKRLPDRQKLVWMGLWNYVDDYGRILDEPGLIAGDLWAMGLSEKQMGEALAGLHDRGRIVRYAVDGEGYIQVTGWDHQKISHPTDSNIPPVPIEIDSGTVQDSFAQEGRGGERKGGGSPPATFCGKHPTGTDDPCRACGDARRAFGAWQLAEKSKPSPKTTMVRPSECDHPNGFDIYGYCSRCGAKETDQINSKKESA